MGCSQGQGVLGRFSASAILLGSGRWVSMGGAPGSLVKSHRTLLLPARNLLALGTQPWLCKQSAYRRACTLCHARHDARHPAHCAEPKPGLLRAAMGKLR